MESTLSSAFLVRLIEIISIAIAFLGAITIHEFSHALTAWLLGDKTARDAGRLTLNPLAHLDPLGLLFIILFRFGWAKPVPMNRENFKYPKLYAIIAALAGPLANFIFALLILNISEHFPFEHIHPSTALFLNSFFDLAVWINVMLGIFNLIPIPPLDGGHIVNAFIPRAWCPTYYRLQPFMLILIFVLIMIPPITQTLVGTIQATILLLKKLVI